MVVIYGLATLQLRHSEASAGNTVNGIYCSCYMGNVYVYEGQQFACITLHCRQCGRYVFAHRKMFGVQRAIGFYATHNTTYPHTYIVYLYKAMHMAYNSPVLLRFQIRTITSGHINIYTQTRTMYMFLALAG